MYANVDLISHARVRGRGMQRNPSVAVDVRDDQRMAPGKQEGPLGGFKFWSWRFSTHASSITYPLALACSPGARDHPGFMAAA